MLLYLNVVDVEYVNVVFPPVFDNVAVYDVCVVCEYIFQLIYSLYAFRLLRFIVIDVPVMYWLAHDKVPLAIKPIDAGKDAYKLYVAVDGKLVIRHILLNKTALELHAVQRPKWGPSHVEHNKLHG